MQQRQAGHAGALTPIAAQEVGFVSLDVGGVPRPVAAVVPERFNPVVTHQHGSFTLFFIDPLDQGVPPKEPTRPG
jgi:hypothetical protein